MSDVPPTTPDQPVYAHALEALRPDQSGAYTETSEPVIAQMRREMEAAINRHPRRYQLWVDSRAVQTCASVAAEAVQKARREAEQKADARHAELVAACQSLCSSSPHSARSDHRDITAIAIALYGLGAHPRQIKASVAALVVESSDSETEPDRG